MTKKSKVVKAWGLKDKDGRIRELTFSRRSEAEFNRTWYDEIIIRVEIREVTNKPRTKSCGIEIKPLTCRLITMEEAQRLLNEPRQR